MTGVPESAALDPRTGLPAEHLVVLRAVDRACTWGRHRPATAPTTRAVRHLVAGGLAAEDARTLLAVLGQRWRTLHPLLEHVGNWGWAGGDDPADDEHTRVGLSPLGRLALDAADGACGPVPLGLVLGDVHPRRPRTQHEGPGAGPVADPGRGAVLRPGFGAGPVLDALAAARSGDPHPSRLLPVPVTPTGAVVDVDRAALLAGQPVRVRLGCRTEVLPPPAVPPPPPGPPPEVVAAVRARGLTSYAWVAAAPRRHAGPSLVITGTPPGVDLDDLEEQLSRAAVTGDPPERIARVADESTDRTGTRLLVHALDPAADVDALLTWLAEVPAATGEAVWHLPGGADSALHRAADAAQDDDTGVQRLAALRA